MGDLNSPEGIERRHIHDAAGSRWRQWPVGLLALGFLLGISVFGVYGREKTSVATTEDIQLTASAPARIRNGELFEMLIRIDAERPISDLVLAIDADLWRDFTINTMTPAAAEEGFERGAFTFSFGSLEAGRALVVKIDGQVNPDHGPAANEGKFSVSEGGGTSLAELSWAIEVLP